MRDAAAVNRMLASMRAVIGTFPDDRQLDAAIESYAGIVAIDAWAVWLERGQGTPVGALSAPPEDADERLVIARAEAALCAGAAAVTAPTTAPIHPYAHGLRVAVSGASSRGALVLLRREELGEFSSEDRAVLVEGRAEFCETLKYLDRLSGGVDVREWAETRMAPVMVVLNEDFTIDGVSRNGTDDHSAFGAPLEPGRRLPAQIDREVREATSSWDEPARRVETTRAPLPGVIARILPLDRDGRYAIGVALERYRERSGLSHAAHRFELTNREVEVVALLLSGLGSAEIGASLHVSESTVNDHVKRILDKVGAANRTEMAAKVLGWRSD